MPEDITLEQAQAMITRAPYHQWLGLKVIALRIAAVIADLGVADVIAFGANAEIVLHVKQGLGQPGGIFSRLAQHVKRESLSRLLSDSREPPEFVNEPLQRRCKVRHG